MYRKLFRIVEEWIAIHEAEGHPLPALPIPPNEEFRGRVFVRIDPELRKSLAICSMREGKSLNTFVTEELTETA